MGDVGPDGREKGCGSWFVARKIPPLDKNGLYLNLTAALICQEINLSVSFADSSPIRGAIANGHLRPATQRAARRDSPYAQVRWPCIFFGLRTAFIP